MANRASLTLFCNREISLKPLSAGMSVVVHNLIVEEQRARWSVWRRVANHYSLAACFIISINHDDMIACGRLNFKTYGALQVNLCLDTVVLSGTIRDLPMIPSDIKRIRKPERLVAVRPQDALAITTAELVGWSAIIRAK